VTPLVAIRSRPDLAGVVVDFDGTLSEIAPTPEAARPVDGAASCLGALAGTFRLVAVVSGRRAAEVASLLGRPAGIRVVGLYGLEDEGGPIDPAAAGLLERIEALLPDVRAIAEEVAGARVEPKGFQIAVHYRNATDPRRAREALSARLAEVGAGQGLRVLDGKKVVELAPAGGPTKGDAVERLVRDQGIRALLYAGDDVADLEAFGAVERFRAAGRDGVTVAVRSIETPEELVHRADLVVDGPAALVRLLSELRDGRAINER
jgi:trehalose 6-phosphate phosphatase